MLATRTFSVVPDVVTLDSTTVNIESRYGCAVMVIIKRAIKSGRRAGPSASGTRCWSARLFAGVDGETIKSDTAPDGSTRMMVSSV